MQWRHRCLLLLTMILRSVNHSQRMSLSCGADAVVSASAGMVLFSAELLTPQRAHVLRLELEKTRAGSVIMLTTTVHEKSGGLIKREKQPHPAAGLTNECPEK